MKITQFDPPANVADLLSTPGLPGLWNIEMARKLDGSIQAVSGFLAARGGGSCQFYNPVSNGDTGPDLPVASGDVPWNGFPKKYLSGGAGGLPDFAGAEAKNIGQGQERPQDEYLEWHVSNNGAGKIVSVEFSCEGYDYFQFLADKSPDVLVKLYQTYVNSSIQKADLYKNGTYDRLNKWTTSDGIMHLTNQANNLYAEVFLAASATVRRKNAHGEITATLPLINCAQYGDPDRNSDPAIGAAVNSLARQGRKITLANPIGLYMADFDGSGFTLPDGSPASGFFQILRGQPGKALRAIYSLPRAQADAGLTVSDVTIGGDAIQYGGQIAQRITMKLTAVASVDQSVHNTPTSCEAIPDNSGVTTLSLTLDTKLPKLPTRYSGHDQ